MNTGATVQLHNQPDLDRNRPRLSPMTTTFDGHDQAMDFSPWANESTFYTDLAYSPDPYLDESMGDYFPLENDQLQGMNGAPVYYSNSAEDLREWSAAGKLSRPGPPPETPLTPMSYFPADGIVSPERWTAETDSEDVISPENGPDPLISTPVSLKRSRSATSSPPVLASISPARASKHKSNHTKTKSKSSNSALSSTKVTETELAKKAGSGRRGSNSIQLRTASRKPRKPVSSNALPSPPSSLATFGTTDADADADGLLTPDERRARRNHNLVEKQYRNRLNAQFERLLAVLPAERQVRNGDDEDGEDGVDAVDEGSARPRIRGIGDDATQAQTGVEDRRISKAEVLDMATRRIKDLESERRRLFLEKRELMHNMEVMSGVVAMAQRRS
ncbi:hypothetical protein B0H67DRAFT_233319 [Lasiosphaeris hirsuta]|uniref:BHLH domain-containing protein n=1 Tax=Lasiosphaeris hirsuta TaxID=260670 RepID=A0AA40AFU8_9PEZI|nr:hypothetical protein B0H67DRAFT_233319 [Lasiosphaeris hirsuta]